MHRRSFFALALAGLTGALAGFRGVKPAWARVWAWDYGAKPPEIWATLKLKDEMSAAIQAANKSLARIRVESIKGERASRIFHEDLEAMTARLTKSAEALR